MSKVLHTALALALAVSVTLVVGGCSADSGEVDSADPAAETATDPAADTSEWTVTLLDGYPDDTVPLYESTTLDTCFFSVRNDPLYVAEGLRNFYHVVFNSSATPDEVLSYYRDLMSSVDEDMGTDEQIVGMIGSYEVVVRSSVWNDETIVYLTVDLPDDQLSDENPFFADYPTGLVETPESFTFIEDVFYRAMLEKTDMSYTRHFAMADLDGDGLADPDEDERYAFFEERYGDAEAFSIDRDAGQITWVDGKYSVTVAYGGGQDRGVLVLGFDAE